MLLTTHTHTHTHTHPSVPFFARGLTVLRFALHTSLVLTIPLCFISLQTAGPNAYTAKPADEMERFFEQVQPLPCERVRVCE